MISLPHSTKKFHFMKLPRLSSQKKTKSLQKQNIRSLLYNLSQKTNYNESDILSSTQKLLSISGQYKTEQIPENENNFNSESSDDSFSFSNMKKKRIHFQLLSRYLISIEFEPRSLLTSEMQSIIEKENGEFEEQMKLWIIPFESYETILKKLFSLKKVNKTFSIKKIQRLAFKVREQADYTSLSIPNGDKTIEISYQEEDDLSKSINLLSERLMKGLYDFQKEGVKFGIKKHGRVLLADEMGIGKTIQAISLCYIYKENWPVLVVCPSSVKYLWKNEIIKWLDIPEDDVQIINQSKTKLNDVNFFIISYDLVRRIDRKLNRKQFDFVILDESHCIKNKDSLRSYYLVPIAQRAKRILLLSGTPLLAKPMEGFTMLSILRPDLFTNFQEYGRRYCDPQPTGFGINWSGASNTKELHYLFNTMMIRRLKKDVLDQLPPKRRMKLEIDCEKKEMKKIKDFYSKNKLKLTIPDIYHITGLAKIKGIKRYVRDLIESGVKFIIFAHHQQVLNAIEDIAIEADVIYIRIDGSVKNQDRYDLVEQFQTNDECKIAILSIHAAGTGITLTESSMVVFAELTWTPAIMIQAEDRAHRIGQKNEHLDIVYLYGKKTIDDFIFKKLAEKLKIVSTTLDDIQSDWAFKKQLNKSNKNDNQDDCFLEREKKDDNTKEKQEGYIDIAEKMIALCNNNHCLSSDMDTASVSHLTDVNLDINLHECDVKRTRTVTKQKYFPNQENVDPEDNSNQKSSKLALYF